MLLVLSEFTIFLYFAAADAKIISDLGTELYNRRSKNHSFDLPFDLCPKTSALSFLKWAK